MKKITIVFSLLAALLTTNAMADTISCQGHVTGLTFGDGGEVYITTTYRSDWMRICSVEYEWNAIGEVTCAMWSKNLTDAYLNDKQITVKYADVTHTCANAPTWGSSSTPQYIRLKE